MDEYERLQEIGKELKLLDSVYSIVSWDLETYMPPRGLILRSEQLGLLRKVIHRMAISSEVGRLLDKAENNASSLNDEQNRNVYLFRRSYDAFAKIPEDLVGALAKQRAISVEVWKKAKATNNWKMFEPELQKMVDLSRKRSEIISEVRGIPILYDSMLDEFERGITSKKISEVFGKLRERLVPLSKKCAEASQDVDTSFLSKKVPIDVQRLIAKDLTKIIGYDIVTENAGGRIDEVEHPFTTGYFDDVRITVKYHEDNISSMIYAILHEGGHALYEQNLNHDWMYQMIGEGASYGIHESQSRFLENMLGRSPEFIKYYYPRLNEFTDGLFSGINLDDFTKAMNLVQPSLIRIEADEVTYSLHIIIRFEIERDLFSEKITVSELPQIWNERYEEYLGLKVPDDTRGVLQDTHWASGYYGYFPSYALGNIYDGVLLEKLNKDEPVWLSEVGKGNAKPAIDWLCKNVHYYSALYDPVELLKHVTGKEMTAAPYLSYLENKYSGLFGF
ncbi:MAG: carboxypeptidase M32 [Candidatus Odinarchaeota archaeon]